MEKIRVFIVDDSLVARSMLIRLLSGEPEIEIVGEAGTGQGGIIMLEEARPDVILLEAKIGGGMSINEVVREIKSLQPEVKVILCAEANAGDRVLTAAEYGASDFVRKPYHKENILRVLRQSVEDRLQ